MSVTPDIHQERQRLLLAMRDAPDYYELAFSASEHAGYLRGLRDAGMISTAALETYMAHAQQVNNATCERFAYDFQQAS